MKNIFGSKTQQGTPKPVEGDAVVEANADAFAQPPVSLAPLWPVGSVFDMYVQVTTSERMAVGPFADVRPGDALLPNFVWKNITFGDWKDERVEDFVIDLPQVGISTFQHSNMLANFPLGT